MSEGSSETKMTRRDALKVAGGLVVGGVVGGLAGYFAAPAKEVIKEVEVPVTPPKREIPKEPIKVGVSYWASGAQAAAGWHLGVGAEIAADWINAEGGILGRRIQVLVGDETAGAAEMVKLYRKWVTEDKVEYVIGVNASSTAIAAAPVFEQELHVPCMIGAATSWKLFEEVIPNPVYVFRIVNNNALEITATLKVMRQQWPDARRIAEIEPDYAYGRESSEVFKAVLKKVWPQAEVVYEGWPPLGTTDYSAHISAIAAAKPDIIYGSLIAGDAINFLKQAVAAGLHKTCHFALEDAVMSTMNELRPEFVPEGMVSSARTYWFEYPPNLPLNKRFVEEALKRGNKYPQFEAVMTCASLYAYKLAVEKAYAAKGEYPTVEDIVHNLEGLSVLSPGGYRHIRKDHEGFGNVVVGVVKYSTKYPFGYVLDPLYVFSPDEYVKPEGTKMIDWINSW
ncbi:MAG: ABC transporter substrate-binding protein [Candidatus Bathyarchaeia archaeon]